MSNTSGVGNTASGYVTLKHNTTGHYNTGVGYHAGCVTVDGHCNTSLGYEATPDSSGYCNTIQIGHCARATASNYTCIGNTSTVCSVVPNLSTNCLTTGAFMESNLRSVEIKEQPTGAVLIWEQGEAKPCEAEYDVRVLGVAGCNSEDPIILGAEPVLITGIISEGDFIVTSEKTGHGKKGVSNNMFGKVIGQALESGTGDSHSVCAMIRKM